MEGSVPFFDGTPPAPCLLDRMTTRNHSRDPAPKPTPPSVYAECPWLVPKDVPEVVAFIRAYGTEVAFRRGEATRFGEGNAVYLIEDGLVATQPGRVGDYERIIGLFGPERILGLIRAVGRGRRKMPLQATALTPVRAVRLEIGRVLDFIEADPALHVRVLRNALHKAESQIDGVIMNDGLPLYARVLWALEVLTLDLDGDEEDVEDGPCPLPNGITITEIGLLVHASREMTSRAVGRFLSCTGEAHRTPMKRNLRGPTYGPEVFVKAAWKSRLRPSQSIPRRSSRRSRPSRPRSPTCTRRRGSRRCPHPRPTTPGSLRRRC